MNGTEYVIWNDIVIERDILKLIEHRSFYGGSTRLSAIYTYRRGSLPSLANKLFEYEFSNELGGIILLDYFGEGDTHVDLPAYYDNHLVVGLRGTFYKNSSLISITIPDSVKSIGDDTFLECTSLSSITIPNSVVSIGEFVFARCYSLTSVALSDNLQDIGDHAFDHCRSLPNVVIPYGVTRIGRNAFSRCTSLADIVIPDSVTSIGRNAFLECIALSDSARQRILQIDPNTNFD